MEPPSSSPASWTVTPVELARRMAHASWFNYLATDSGVREIFYRVWLLRRGTQILLVDTGPDPQEGRRRGLLDIRPLAQGLREVGVGPDEVRDVLLTHLHWDHASSLGQLPRATFWVQPQELAFFQGEAWQHPSTARFFSHREALDAAFREGRLRPLDEQGPRWDGVEIVRVGGHTPGSQMVKVDTASGLSVLSGDVIPMNDNYTQDLPTGILVDLLEVLEAKRLLRTWNPQRLYTGHDPQPYLDCAPTRGGTQDGGR
jgi:glyoxylase-like metal-dependent hydrolase (beta-lactamase superfamily II)